MIKGRAICAGRAMPWACGVATALAVALGAAAADPPAPAERARALFRTLAASRSYDEREAAREELAALDAEADGALEEALAHEAARVRRAACELLGRRKRAEAASRLAARLQDDDPDVRDAALDALERLGPPGADALRAARDDQSLPAAVADAALERPVKREAERLLNACISKDLGWGFYKDQFRDVVTLGPAVAPVLLRLFTTPELDYAFTYDFDEEGDPARIRYRKQVIQRLAGEALVDLKDVSVVPDLKLYLERLGTVDPLDETDPRHDLYETTVFVLMRLGEPEPYERLKATFVAASGATTDAAGELVVALDGEAGGRRRRAFTLARLAYVELREGDAAGAGRLRDKLAETAAGLEPPPGCCAALEEVLRAAAPDAAALKPLENALRDELLDRQRLFRALSRLAMLQIKADDLEGTVRTYTKILALARELDQDEVRFEFDRNRDGELATRERQAMEETLAAGRYRGRYAGILTNAYYNMACAFSQQGRKAEAIAHLKKAVDAGYEDAEWIQKDRDLDAIKDEEEYKTLMKRLERLKQRREEENPGG